MVRAELAHIVIHEHEQDELIRSATGDALDVDASAILEDMRRSHLPGAASLTAETVAQDIRAFEGKNMEWTQKHIAEINDGLAMLTFGCDGLLKMRAARGGIVFTATVCAAPIHLEREASDDGIEPAIVHRREIA